MASATLAVLEELASVLDRLGVPFVVGGSLASGAWGEPRSTHDVDILIRLKRDRVGELVEALSEAFYVSREAVAEALRDARAFNVIHTRRFQKVDVFVAGPGPLDVAQLERPVERPRPPGWIVPPRGGGAAEANHAPAPSRTRILRAGAEPR